MLSTRNSITLMGGVMTGQGIDQAGAIMVERTMKHDRVVSCRTRPALRRRASLCAEVDGFSALTVEAADRDSGAVRPHR